jgi:hypothetical protein
MRAVTFGTGTCPLRNTHRQAYRSWQELSPLETRKRGEYFGAKLCLQWRHKKARASRA